MTLARERITRRRPDTRTRGSEMSTTHGEERESKGSGASAPPPGSVDIAPADPDSSRPAHGDASWPPPRMGARAAATPLHRRWPYAVIAAMLLLAVGGVLLYELQGKQEMSVPPVTVPTGPPPKPFRDCQDACPWMVTIPPGRFLMGSPSGEDGHEDDESPVHEVIIGHAFSVSEYPVTRGQWRQYVEAAHPSLTGCGGASWLNPGFGQQDSHPVVCVTWNEAEDYTLWLSRKTAHHYRLLSESEYEYVNRAGTRTPYFWGYSSDGQCRYANGDDPSAGCSDGYPYTSPVGAFRPNAFGLYDTTGNVLSWTQDCWHGSYRGAPADGSPWTASGNCAYRVLRGGAWNNVPHGLRSAFRVRVAASIAYNFVGLRVARDP